MLDNMQRKLLRISSLRCVVQRFNFQVPMAKNRLLRYRWVKHKRHQCHKSQSWH